MKPIFPILTTCLLLCAPVLAASADKPNIIYMLADDMGYADPEFNGGKQIKTPSLNKLAAAGTVLSSFYGQPLCSPTRASLMTGRYVAHTGVYSVVKPHTKWGLPLAERTLPQALQEAGYETAITGKWHLGESQPAYLPTKRGFEHQYGLWFGNIDYFTHMRDGELDWHRDDQPLTEEGYSTHLIGKEACRLIRERNPSKPLFLYLPFNAVHGPHQVPESYEVPYATLAAKRKTYAGMVAAMDEAIGQVVAALDTQKMTDNTLIIFSSDNGGPSPGTITDNGPLRGGKGSIFEGGVRLCAFACWPGHIPAGKVVDQPVHAVDWYPTCVNLAGGKLEQPLPLDGKDIWPVLTQGAKSPHDAILLSGTVIGKTAVRAGDWKLLLGQSDGKEEKEKDAKMSKGEDLLFNLAEDIGEKNNLADKNPEKLAEMKGILDRLLKDAVPSGDPEARNRKKGDSEK